MLTLFAVIASADATEIILEILRKSQTQFAFGVVVGALLALGIYWLMAKERRDFLGFVKDTQKEIREQNNLKDARIAKLHDQINRIVSKEDKS